MNDFFTSLKEQSRLLMERVGNVRGEIIADNIAYIASREDGPGLAIIEEKLRELGFPLKLSGFQKARWYPEALSVLIVLIAKDLLNWQEEDVFMLGSSVPESSSVVQMLKQVVFSPEQLFRQLPEVWKAQFDFGAVESTEFQEAEHSFSFRIMGYQFHPVMCQYYAGYFLGVTKFFIKNEKILIYEKACAFKGADFHEYTVKWE